MQLFLKLLLSASLAVVLQKTLDAQDLTPRAYVITPLHANAVTLAWSFYSGSINFNGALPVSDATGSYSVPILSYYHSFDFFGRSANVVASLPYGVGNFNGTVAGAGLNIYRSGLVDSVYRISVNLKGGPAMEVPQYMKWKQKVLLGASLKIIAPTGQYDPTKLINWGTNRWSFKPEFGYSQRWQNKWMLDGYLGGWFFTKNSDFWSHNSYYAGIRSQTQNPMGSVEGHLSYNFKPRLWASLDGNFWFGGKTSVNGIQNPLSEQSNSRLGGTVAIPITKHQSVKVSYSNGTYIRYGGNYQNVQAAWQYSWVGKP
jgi:Putative MetA-pathway of phenol degradation